MVPDGVVSLLQTTTRDGKRSSTYHAFLEGEAEQRPNLEVICGAHVTRVVLERRRPAACERASSTAPPTATTASASAAKEVVLSAGAVGSPHILMLSGIGPRHELEAVGVSCRLDSADVGKHLKDHLQVGLFFPAPGGRRLDAGDGHLDGTRRACGRPQDRLPADPADDANLPAELQALKAKPSGA